MRAGEKLALKFYTCPALSPSFWSAEPVSGGYGKDSPQPTSACSTLALLPANPKIMIFSAATKKQARIPKTEFQPASRFST
jgi:hypothetical protein